MDLKEIVERQISADQKRGFPVEFMDDRERYDQILKELVGLIGEIGEFANVVKKIGLGLDNPKYSGPAFESVDSELREEIADSMIYIMRISAIIGANLQEDILKKMKYNEKRYRSLERE